MGAPARFVGPEGDAAGVLLLQGLSAFAALGDEAHHADCPVLKDPRLRADPPWRPASKLAASARVGASETRGAGAGAQRRVFGSAAAWGPDERGSHHLDLLPSVLAVPFVCPAYDIL